MCSQNRVQTTSNFMSGPAIISLPFDKLLREEVGGTSVSVNCLSGRLEESTIFLMTKIELQLVPILFGLNGARQSFRST